MLQERDSAAFRRTVPFAFRVWPMALQERRPLEANGTTSGSGGNQSETFVYLGDDYGISPKAVSHEAAHYYWVTPVAAWTPFANLAWVSEGAAQLLAYGPDTARDEWVEDERNTKRRHPPGPWWAALSWPVAAQLGRRAASRPSANPAA